MSPTHGNRATDPDGLMPPADEKKYLAARSRDRILRAWITVAFAVALLAAGYTGWSNHQSSERDTARDRAADQVEARRSYELCRQRRSAAQSQNANADTARDAHLGARHRALELARLERDPAKRRILLAGAKARLEQYRAVLFAEEPQCERLYPRGAALFSRLGPVLPSDAATTPTGGASAPKPIPRQMP